MAKKKSTVESDSPAISAAALALGGAMGLDISDNANLQPGEILTDIYGTRIPWHSGRRLFGIDVIPAKKFILLEGIAGTGKTALSMEFSKWIIQQGGLASCIHTESKTMDTLIVSILKEYMSGYFFNTALDFEEWGAMLCRILENLKIPSTPGLTNFGGIQTLVTIDSIVGAAVRGELDKADKKTEGLVGKAISPVAGAMSRNLPQWAKLLMQTSATIILVSHLKERTKTIGSASIPYHSAVGGVDREFSSAITLRLFGKSIDGTAKREVDVLGNGSIKTRIVCHKNALAPGGFCLDDFIFSWKIEDGVQTSEYNWEEQNTKLMCMYATYAAGNPTVSPRLTELMSKFSATGNGRYKHADVANGTTLLAKEFGLAMEENREFSDELDLATGIVKRKTVAEFAEATKGSFDRAIRILTAGAVKGPIQNE